MADLDDKKGGKPGAAQSPPGTRPSAPQSSGRATFDERGVAVWEWQVQTGSFDLNADSQKVRALTNVELSIAEPSTPRKPGYKAEGFNPYAEPEPPARTGPQGRNPYSTGAKRPENVSYNPHRPPPVVKPRPEVAEQLAKRPTPAAEPAKKGLLSSLFGRDDKK